jgi:hypothetical protein
MIYLIILGVLTLYHIFDFIFRNILMEKSVGSFYFKLQAFSVITFIFDFGMPIFILLRFIFMKTINKDNEYLSPKNLQIILYVFSFLQSFKYIRFIKVYLMVNKLYREIEKKKKYKEIVEESKKKQLKTNKASIMVTNQQRLSKIKTFNVTNLSAFKSLNIGKNDNASMVNTANNNNSMINTNKMNGNNNKNENNNTTFNNVSKISKKESEKSKINEVNNKTNNNNITNLGYENASIIPLNMNAQILSPKGKPATFLNRAPFTFKEDDKKSKMKK